MEKSYDFACEEKTARLYNLLGDYLRMFGKKLTGIFKGQKIIDMVKIPEGTGKPFLDITQLLSENSYSGPYDVYGEDFYRFVPIHGRKNTVLVNPVEGIMMFIYPSLDDKEKNGKKFLDIKKTIEEKFKK